jgi:hypothetical protein
LDEDIYIGEDRASSIAVKIQPKFDNQGRFCPAGLHGQPVLKFLIFFKFFTRDAQRIPVKWNKYLTSIMAFGIKAAIVFTLC